MYLAKETNMYEQYFSIVTIPTGDILKRILSKENISQRQLAMKANELPQQINDLIAGRRKFTPEQLIKIEKALGIEIPGFFYKIQANHTIYLIQRKEQLKHKPDLSFFRRAIFGDIDLEQLDWIENKEWIIQRVFEYGNEKEIETILQFYGKETVSSLLAKVKTKWNATKRIGNISRHLQ